MVVTLSRRGWRISFCGTLLCFGLARHSVLGGHLASVGKVRGERGRDRERWLTRNTWHAFFIENEILHSPLP